MYPTLQKYLTGFGYLLIFYAYNNKFKNHALIIQDVVNKNLNTNIMEYTNQDIRRQDRLMDENRANEMLENGEYGVLSMQAEDGGGYGVPVNYVWDGKDSIYIHCAIDGEKMRCIEKNNNVSFCVIGRTRLIPRMFTTEYESIMLKGTAHIDLNDDEKMKALMMIVKKFSPDFITLGAKYSEKSFHRVNLIRVDFTKWSGKCKHVKE